MRDVYEWVWLQMCFDLGSPKVDSVLETYGHPGAFRKAVAERREMPFLTQPELRRVRRTKWEAAVALADKTLRAGYSIITPDDAAFPSRLAHIYGRPCCLYAAGTLPPVEQTATITIVGTRKPTVYGRRAAEEIACQLARAGAIVVSGFAYGIDEAAHEGALQAGGVTVAVLACGLDVNYPAEHAALRRQICKNGGCLLTEYPLGQGVQPKHFRVRNRLLSGLSLGVVVVEAGEKSGALITAGHALEQGRDVFAVPGDIYNPLAIGSNQLLKEGASPVQNAEDILGEYRLYYPDKMKRPVHKQAECADDKGTGGAETIQGDLHAAPPTLPDWVEGAARQVYECLGASPCTASEIAAKTGCPLCDVLPALTRLELEGLVRPHPGGAFTRRP